MSQAVDVPTILRLLVSGTLEIQGPLPYSSNYTLLVTACGENLEMPAVYKPRRGERPLWDFPRGTLYLREVAAYLVSEMLGWALVPPTVVRDGPYGVGMLQLYVANDADAHLFTMEQEGGYEDVIRRLCVFDVLINNADRKSGHCLKGLDGRLWAIDHGICFHSEYKLRTVVWDYVGQPLDDEILDALTSFRDQLDRNVPAAELLCSLLADDETRAMRRRLHTLLRTRVFPAPGAGPNIPWPPV